MPDQYAARNYYDKSGRLLLAKGHKVTEKALAMLNDIITYNKINDENNNSEENHVINNEEIRISAKDISERMKIHNESILEYPSMLLSKILFESKAKPWWIYINALSNYIDWLYTHSLDVALISLIMSIGLGYDNEDYLQEIGLGALLHDIGKLLVPKSIILKPGCLNEQEKSYVRQHCELGISVTKQFNLSHVCTNIILQHHERLDGSGYPFGLKGDVIDDAAKIVMIADVLDAITSYRPYRNPCGLTVAFEELKNEENKLSSDFISTLMKVLQF
jgi:putative nucleotidyltransferase with HDIG domain